MHSILNLRMDAICYNLELWQKLYVTCHYPFMVQLLSWNLSIRKFYKIVTAYDLIVCKKLPGSLILFEHVMISSNWMLLHCIFLKFCQ